MLRIAICDDEKYFRAVIKKHIQSYLTEREIECEVDTFSSGRELLEPVIELVRYNIVFLDINMDELDGIATAQKIREYSTEMYIVFVTAYISYSLEGYKVDATRFLLKNNINMEASLSECMDTILVKMNYVVPRNTFHFKEGEKNILLEKIIYIESRLHKLEFHIIEDEIRIYTLYGTLNDLEKEIKEFTFLRIHQSFLVNLRHIKSIEGYCARLCNNQILMIPRIRYRDVKNAFVAYKGEL